MNSRDQSCLRFRLGEHTLAFPLTDVREVVALPELLILPTMAPVLCGIMNLDGASVPVLQLSRVLSCPADSIGPYSPVLVVVTEGGMVGLIVDEVQGVVSINRGTWTGVEPGQTFEGVAVGAFVADESSIVLLSAQRLLTEEERRRTEHFREMGRQRLEAFETAEAAR